MDINGNIKIKLRENILSMYTYNIHIYMYIYYISCMYIAYRR